MNAFYYKSKKEDDLYKTNFQKRFKISNNSIEYKRNSRDSLKQNSNINDNSSTKNIKKINYVSGYKTFYRNTNFYKNNSVILENQIPKSRYYLNSFNKIRNKLKFKQSKTLLKSNSMFNISNIYSYKNSKYSKILKNDSIDINLSKKIDLKFPKSKDLNNISKINYFNVTSSRKSRNSRNIKYNSQSKIDSMKEYKNISVKNEKSIQICKPFKILQYNTQKSKTSSTINIPPVIKNSTKNINQKDKISLNKDINIPQAINNITNINSNINNDNSNKNKNNKNKNNNNNKEKTISNDNNNIPPAINNDLKNNEKHSLKNQYTSLIISKEKLQNILDKKFNDNTTESFISKELIKRNTFDNSLKNISNISKTTKDSNILIPKIKNNYSKDNIESSSKQEEVFKNDSNINIRMLKKKSSKNSNNNPSNSDTLNNSKKSNSSNKITPKAVIFKDDDSSNNNINKSIIQNFQIFKTIKNGRSFNLGNNNIFKNINYKNTMNIKNISYSTKSLISLKPEEESKNIGEREDSLNNFKSEVNLLKEDYIKEIFIDPKKMKFKFLNLIVEKNKKTNKKNIIFLNKIKRDYEYRNYCLNNIIKKSKKSLLYNQIEKIEKIKSIKKEDLRTYNLGNNLNDIKKVLKNDYIKAFKKSKKKYNDFYLDLKNIINFFIYHGLYTPFLKKCNLDINTINYITFNNSFSTIYLPIIEFSIKRRAIFLKGKLMGIKKNISFLEDKKSKFIESIRSTNMYHNVSFNFILKELDNHYIDNSRNNSLDEYINRISPRDDKYNSENKSNLNNNLNSKKKSNRISNNSIKMKKKSESLSLLTKTRFFDLNNKGDNKIGSFKKKSKKRSAVNNDNKFKRVAKKNSVAYYDFIKSIIEKDNTKIILKNLINEGEIFLFMEYFNNNSRNLDINIQDEDGNTFLILCVKQNLEKLVKFLLERGINPNIQNNVGNSALHYALSGRNFKMADILRKYGAYEDCTNKLGLTPWDGIGKNIDIDEINK